MKDDTGDSARFQSAIDDLIEAIRLAPDNYLAYHERAYLYNETGEPAKAEADLNAQMTFTPASPELYQERALSRFMQGKLVEALQDRNKVVELEPQNPGRYFARARAFLWLGHFDDARHDLETMSELARKADDTQSQERAKELQAEIARWSEVTSDEGIGTQACLHAEKESDYLAETFIGDCTRAFLHAPGAEQRSDALTNRSIGIELWKQDRSAGLDDLRLALAFSPDEADRHFNLGSRLENIGRVREALPHLDIAVSQRPSAWAYAARADAKYQLADVKGAFADARQSVEMKPNELALTVLGDIARNNLKDDKAAINYWKAAYELGDRDDGLKARLESVGLGWPPSAGDLPKK